MSGSEYSIQHWQQRALLAERRLAENQLSPSPRQSHSPLLSEKGLDSSSNSIPLELLSAINSNFSSSIQAHDVSGAASLLRAFHEDHLQLQREHENLQSMISRQSLTLDTMHLLQVLQSHLSSTIEPSQSPEEVEESAHAVEVLTQENEALRVQIEELLQQSRREGEVLHSSRNRLRPDKESLDDLIRSFEMQLSERDHRIDAMEIELQSCYQNLGENEAEHRHRYEQDRISIVLKDGLISSFQKQLSDREEQVQTLTAELNSCYARLLESDSLLESACSSLQENIKLGQEAAEKVARHHADVLLSAGKYFLKHDFSETSNRSTRSTVDNQRANVSRSSPRSASVAATPYAIDSNLHAEHEHHDENPLILSLSKMNV